MFWNFKSLSSNQIFVFHHNILFFKQLKILILIPVYDLFFSHSTFSKLSINRGRKDSTFSKRFNPWNVPSQEDVLVDLPCKVGSFGRGPISLIWRFFVGAWVPTKGSFLCAISLRGLALTYVDLPWRFTRYLARLTCWLTWNIQLISVLIKGNWIGKQGTSSWWSTKDIPLNERIQVWMVVPTNHMNFWLFNII